MSDDNHAITKSSSERSMKLASKVKLNSKDITGIKVAEFEKKLRMAKNSAQKELMLLNKAYTDACDRVSEAEKKLCDKSVKTEANKIVKSLSKLGKKFIWKTTTIERSDDELQFLLQIFPTGSTRSEGITIPGEVKLSSEYKDLLKRRDAAYKESHDKNMRITDIDIALNNLDVLERQMNARLARATLKQTEGGEEILQEMDGRDECLGELFELSGIELS